MIELLLVFISFLYGFIFRIITKKLNNNIILYSIFSFLFVCLYVFTMYKLYNGKISLLLKISLIAGYIICKVLENNVKLKKKIIKS